MSNRPLLWDSLGSDNGGIGGENNNGGENGRCPDVEVIPVCPFQVSRDKRLLEGRFRRLVVKKKNRHQKVLGSLYILILLYLQFCLFVYLV